MSSQSLSFNPSVTNWLQGNITKTERQLATMKPLESSQTDTIKTREACKEFESLFLNYLLKEMRATIPKSGLFDGGPAEEIYTSMFDEGLSKKLAQHGGIGLAKIIEDNLSMHQEAALESKRSLGKI